MNTAVLALLVSFKQFAATLLAAQAPYEWGWHMHPMWSWGWGVFVMAMVFLVSGVVIFAGMMGLHWFNGNDKQPPADSAMDILRQRFARGEIDKDEFEAKKKALSN
jgi:putative membrane protein